MVDKTYIVNQESPESIAGFENFNSQDVSLINSFEVNTLFNPDKNFMELHVISLIDELLESDYNYVNYKQLGNAQSAGKSGASVLTLDPISDVKRYGYENGSVKLLYHFLNDLFSETKTPIEFFIESISEDRTELRLQTLQLSAEKIVERVNEIKTKLQDQSYFSEFRLDFKNNDLLIGLNIDTFDLGFDKAVIVKLYEPLPVEYVEKSKLTIVELIADSVAYEVDYEVTEDEPVNFSLKPANFNLEVADNHIIPTGYFNYEELFSYPVNNSNSQIYSMISQKGIELSIDHTDYSNFIHFSSAQERLLNFKYKLDLISSSYANINVLNSATTGISGVSGSQQYYNGVIEGILNNFDHYERFLYYESGSSSWPKSNTTKPYINKPSTALESTTWFSNQLTTAVTYDLTNYNSVLSAIPSYIKDDTNNEAYLTFVFMIGQHFDLLWIYAKAVTDKYDADNRVDYGISKDLVGEALRNFGIKLYTSNKSVEDLFTTFIGQAYQSGSEVINYYVTGSITGSNTPIQPVSYDNYQKEVQKRIYHNLPLLLKTKGTERGLRALINCLGISGDLLDIKLFGGRNVNEKPFFGDSQYYTSSLDKIRLDNTGSIVSGSTLSNYVSIVKRDDKYTDDIHVVEVGFAPADNIDNYILANITGSFNIDDYIGNPGGITSGSYSELQAVASGVLGSLSRYNLQDYIRLIKFYDNTVFKMVKDFVPARTNVDTGIVIKPNLLNRSKAKSVTILGSRPEYTGSIRTAFIKGGNTGTFNTGLKEWQTSYTDNIQSPEGITYNNSLHGQEQPKYDGEFKGSKIVTTTGNLTANNPYLVNIPGEHLYDIYFVSSSDEVCLLETRSIDFQYITSSTQVFQSNDFFNYPNGCNFFINSTSITFPYIFGTGIVTPYVPFTLTAINPVVTVGSCQADVTLVYGVCYVDTTGNAPASVMQNSPIPYNLTQWFTTAPTPSGNVQYTANWYDGTSNQSVVITNPSSYVFSQDILTPVTITVKDTGLGEMCKKSVTTTVFTTNLGTVSTSSMDVGGGRDGLEFAYSFQYEGYYQIDYDYDTGDMIEIPVDGTDYPKYLGYSSINYYPYANNIKGIPGYFTPYNFPVNSVGIGPQTRYSVYALTNTDPVNGGWKITETLPIGLESGTEDFQDVNAYTSTSPIVGDNPPYIGPPYPIVQQTQYHTPDDLMFQYGPSAHYYVDVNTLVRAYVIQAYSNGFPDLYQQVTVYGDGRKINRVPLNPAYGKIEGAYAEQPGAFIDIWLLQDWQYGTGPGQLGLPSGQSSIYQLGSDSGTWFKVPIRYYKPVELTLQQTLQKFVYPQYP